MMHAYYVETQGIYYSYFRQHAMKGNNKRYTRITHTFCTNITFISKVMTMESNKPEKKNEEWTQFPNR